METLKKIVNTASFANTASVAHLWDSISSESKALISFSTLFIILFTFFNKDQLTLFIHSNMVYNPIITESNRPSNNLRLKKIDVRDLVGQNLSYSYKEASLAFYLESNDFFNLNTKNDVEKKLAESIPFTLRKNAKKYIKATLKLSELHQIDPIWVLSVMWTESHFQFHAKSWAGARGLMQIMPATKKYVYRKYRQSSNKLIVETKDFNINEYFPYKVSKNLYKKHERKLINIELGIIYLKSLLRDFRDNHTYATVAYNMGPGWTRGRLRRKLPVGNDNEYLNKVQKAYRKIIRKI